MVLPSSRAAAQPEREEELLHADTPLWSTGSTRVWPQHFTEEGAFGCIHPIKLGIWRFEDAADQEADPEWFSFTNYGVFHCWMNVAQGFERDDLESSRPGFLVDLGVAARGRDLWVLQLGARPGSDYLLLARVRELGAIAQFEVLQRACPVGRRRGGWSLEILLTRYCHISSKRELIALARRMAKRPSLGTLRFAEAEPAEAQ